LLASAPETGDEDRQRATDDVEADPDSAAAPTSGGSRTVAA
jgi:hypothetical protein